MHCDDVLIETLKEEKFLYNFQEGWSAMGGGECTSFGRPSTRIKEAVVIAQTHTFSTIEMYINNIYIFACDVKNMDHQI